MPEVIFVISVQKGAARYQGLLCLFNEIDFCAEGTMY